eukprot:gb/GECG01004330.1/.p1 GENE.gb/GECG01004330.1/~~gb/GECG01004330.1/.p1  ORF type:complete len:1590 (+),score=184.72 gb/GECG01004330.1/:1-4770(+)
MADNHNHPFPATREQASWPGVEGSSSIHHFQDDASQYTGVDIHSPNAYASTGNAPTNRRPGNREKRDEEFEGNELPPPHAAGALPHNHSEFEYSGDDASGDHTPPFTTPSEDARSDGEVEESGTLWFVKDGKRVCFWVVMLSLMLLLWHRDRRRRAMGLSRRSPRWGVVYLLSQVNSSWTKRIAGYIARHRWQFYISVVAGIWGIIKGNQKLQHWLFQFNRKGSLDPSDSLVAYPSEEPVATSLNKRRRRSWKKLHTRTQSFPDGSAAHASSGGSSKDTLKTYADSETVSSSADSQDRDGSEPEDREELLREKVAGAREEQDEADTAVLAATDERLAATLGRQGLRVLRMFEHTIQGISLDVTVSAYQKMREVHLEPGEVLFKANGEATDGMYIITGGRLDIYADNSAHPGNAAETSAAKEMHTLLPALKHVYGEMLDIDELDSEYEDTTPRLLSQSPKDLSPNRRYLCSFRSGQSIGENALLEGPGATRAVTAVAGEDGAEMLQVNDELFCWLADQYPQALVSFILITTSRQWRVAYLTLVEYLGLPGAFEASAEEWPHPKFDFNKSKSDGESKDPQEDIPGLKRCSYPRIESTKTITETAASSVLTLNAGESLYHIGDRADSVYILLDGKADALVPASGKADDSEGWKTAGRLVEGSIAGGISCFVDIPQRETMRASSKCRWAVFSRRKFSDLGVEDLPVADSSRIKVLLDIALIIGRALTPLLRLHLGLGLQRVWLRSGDVLYRKDEPSDGMYLVIHGRLRAYTNLEGSNVKKDSRRPHFHMQRGKFLRHGTAQFDFPPGYDTSNTKAPRPSEKHRGAHGNRSKAEQGNYSHGDGSGFRVEVARGESIGELSVLLEREEREHTAICVRDCELVRITPEAFDRLSTLFPVVMKQFTAILAQRYLSLVNHLSNGSPSSEVSLPRLSRQPFHSRLDFSRMQRMAKRSHYRPRNQLMEAFKTPTDPKNVPGQTVSSPRTSSSIVTIAIVHAGGSLPAPSVVSAFTATVCQRLRTFGSVIHVNSNTIDRRLGEGTTARVNLLFERARVAAWLSAKEESHRFVVMETDPSCTAWTKMAVQHCDLALLVGQAHTSAELSSVERCIMFTKVIQENGKPLYIPRTFCKRELVLLHPDSSQPPRNTRDWLRRRPVGWHHHVRLGELGDYGRLARFIAGKAVGVVLSGGGSRGLAHLGIIRSLEARGVPIDFIGGTSQGAFMGGAYAKGLTSSTVMTAARILSNRIGSTWGVVQSLTLPIISYFSGESFNVLLQQALGDTQIEDLWIKYFCVTTNVTKDRMDVHQTGPLWRYARASMTVMGLLPPMLDVDGSILVDGGYVNNLPVDVMRKICPSVSTVLAVDVENKDNSALENVTNYGDHISGWYLAGKVILSWLGLGEKVHIPSTSLITLKLSYISHTMAIKDILSKAEAAGDNTFLYIQPDVQDFALLDYHKLSEIMTLGYLEAESVLDELYVNNHEHELCQYMTPSTRARYVLYKLSRRASEAKLPYTVGGPRRSESMGQNVSSLPHSPQGTGKYGSRLQTGKTEDHENLGPAGRCVTDLQTLRGTNVSSNKQASEQHGTLTKQRSSSLSGTQS